MENKNPLTPPYTENIKLILKDYPMYKLFYDLLKSLLNSYYCILHDFYYPSNYIRQLDTKEESYNAYLDYYAYQETRIKLLSKIIQQVSSIYEIQSILEKVYGPTSNEVQLYKKAFYFMNCYLDHIKSDYQNQCKNDEYLASLLNLTKGYYLKSKN